MRRVLAGAIVALAMLGGSAWAQNDAELANPEYWQARFAQARAEVSRAAVLERDAREELKEALAEAPKGERERDEMGWQREEQMMRDAVREAAAQRLRAENELEALEKAAKDLGIPPYWYGRTTEAAKPAVAPAKKPPAGKQKSRRR